MLTTLTTRLTASISAVVIPRPTSHHPKLVQRLDGRWEIRCPQCERNSEPPPIGIDDPVANKFEAESMLQNHSGRAA